MKRVYACGPITGLSYEDATKGWRIKLARLIEEDPLTGGKSGIRCISPLRGKNYLENFNAKLDGKHTAYSDTLLSSAKSIVCRDRFDVMKNCDLMIANLVGAERVSIGSMVEYGWADAVRVPIVTIIEEDGSNIHEHAFIHELSLKVVHTIEDAAYIARSLLTDAMV